MPHPITEPMRQQHQQQQKIATRLPAPPSLLALGSDDLDWDDQYTVVTNSPSLAAINSRGTESRISSPTGTTKIHSGGGLHNISSNVGGYSNSAMIFSEDEDEPSPLGSSLSHGNNGNNMLSSLFPNIRGSSHSSAAGGGGGGFTDPMLTSPAYHCFQAENALITLKQVVRDDGWKKALKHKSGVVVHMKNGVNKADKTPLFKGQAIIQGFSPQSIFYVIGMRRLWDENYEDGNLIENLNETTSLTYEVSKATATSKPRDLSLIEKIECTHDGAIIFACTSVESPRIPKIPGRVRAQIKLQGWILEPIRGSITPATRVTFVTQENMKGWIPGFTKKSLARRPLVIAAINDYLQRKADRMRAQKKSSQHAPRPSLFGTSNNSNTLEPPPPTKRKPHRILTQQHALSSQQSFESAMFDPSPTSSQRSSQRSILVDQSSTYPATKNQHSSTQRKHITFAESDVSDREPDDVPTLSPTTLKQIPSQQQQQQQQQQPQHRQQQRQTIPSRHLYPSHRHPTKKVESLELLKRLSSSLDDWMTKGEIDGVKLYTKAQPDRPSFLRGDGVIEGEWTAEQLCSLIHCYGARKIWDERFEGGQVVERFSQKEYLVHWSLRNMYPVTNCDISAITTIETNSSTGTIYTASTSVNDPLIPASTKEANGSNSGHIRGHTDLYGWMFTSNLGEGGRTKSVNVTMVCNLVYKCHVPANVAKVMENEMLASVANVRNYIQKYGCPPYIRRVAGKVVEEDFEAKTGTYQVTFIAKHEPSQAYRQRKSGWCTDIRVHKSVYSGGLDVKVSPTEGTRVEMTSDHKSVRIFTTSSEMEGKRVVVLLTTENRSTGAEKDVAFGSSSKQQQRQPGMEEEKNINVENEEVSLKEPAQLPSLQHQQQQSVLSATEKVSTGQAEPAPVTPTSSTHSILNHPLHPLQAASIAQTPPNDQQAPLSPTAFSHISTASGNLQVPKGYMLVPQSHQSNNIIIISDDLTFNGQQLAVVFLAMVLCYYMGKFACSCS
ncbi:hypothetical protein BDB00DRAFT_468279 [Zychaea mexicana]|uniref:uncharacterized protein n=1 Tax=Zychaea mexicana TaxID=64656 RepID=UPI0022FF3926|nr:uncharacterized protein BDB00DRAFT_468279 [Zychaea mexicana]KAI9491869.1 hypothetical protein BDB00DRAFT_468279 [Zychaea mexicana]